MEDVGVVAWGALQTTPRAGPLPAWATGTPARVVAAVALFVAVTYLSKYLVRLLERPVAARFARESVSQTVLRFIRLVAVLAAAAVGAGLLGFEASDVLISVTVFSAVLGVVLAPIVGGFINGLFVLADQPYEIGDMVELADGTQGFIRDITLRYTKILTTDNTILVIPNARIREQQVTNFTAEDERMRLSLSILVTYQCDLAAARDLFERAARRCEEVIDGGPDIRIGAARYPAAPTAYVDEYADSGVRLTLRYWASQPFKPLTVRSNVQTELRRLMAESDADVEIAYPHRQVVFGDEAGRRVGAGGGGDDRNGEPVEEEPDGGADAGVRDG